MLIIIKGTARLGRYFCYIRYRVRFRCSLLQERQEISARIMAESAGRVVNLLFANSNKALFLSTFISLVYSSS